MAAGIEVALAHTERTTGRQDTQHLASDVIAQQIIKVYAQTTGHNIQQFPKETGDEQIAKETPYAQKQ